MLLVPLFVYVARVNFCSFLFFRLENVVCAGEVYDVVEVLCIHALNCGCVVDVW